MQMTDAQDGWEEWMDNPLAIDNPEGTTVADPETWHMQLREPGGKWVAFNTPRTDRDEVTRIQAFHLNDNPGDTNLRVWKRQVSWVLDEVPGDGDGQTPTADIIARNEENTKLLAEQQPE
jgi:hypothetical protein